MYNKPVLDSVSTHLPSFPLRYAPFYDHRWKSGKCMVYEHTVSPLFTFSNDSFDHALLSRQHANNSQTLKFQKCSHSWPKSQIIVPICTSDKSFRFLMRTKTEIFPRMPRTYFTYPPNLLMTHAFWDRLVRADVKTKIGDGHIKDTRLPINFLTTIFFGVEDLLMMTLHQHTHYTNIFF